MRIGLHKKIYFTPAVSIVSMRPILEQNLAWETTSQSLTVADTRNKTSTLGTKLSELEQF